MRLCRKRPCSTTRVAWPSSSRAKGFALSFASDRPTSSTINVAITSIALVKEKSSPNNACWVASPMISRRTKSNVVRSASERRPATRNSSIRATYMAAARRMESMAHSYG
ncbi:hypothetical protein WR25_00524 [Diploscapter pachys]|uniref:Uncharacterized protein n=1 Tax=Diploscapter pachys TaxID=2018661 RepID=A0A2A2KL96_9BILA|nr:hypothetical protein WR25_00524 [Diploscapter pachys]